MIFAHDTEVAIAAATALVNTASAASLETVADLDVFADEWSWTGSRTHSRVELDAVLEVREKLGQLWSADTDQLVSMLNRLLSEAHALPQLVRHDGWDWHLHATDPSAPLADRMAVEAAMGFVDVVRAGELDRLRTCAAEDCDDVLVDLSKNRSRRYCAKGCGNRVNVAAYRARQSS